ncbi:MAG: TetR/AcrR family transcriptional regulator [Hyphomicrobiaceae bacterium]
MPKLKPDTQRARREHILDAAERCFANSGFHACSMQEICSEAGISPGAFYVYFKSKEDLIAGIVERDRAAFGERFRVLGEAPDFMAALSALGDQCLVDEPRHRQLMCMEIWLEATRNERVSELFHSVDDFIVDGFRALFDRLHAEKRISPKVDSQTLTDILAVIGDGIYARRVIDPNFDPRSVLPPIIDMLTQLIQPTEPTPKVVQETQEGAEA